MTGRRPDIITSLGVARTFQNIRLFSTMSALENVMVGEHSRMSAGLFGSILRTPGVRREEREVRERARETLEYVGLSSSHFDAMAVNALLRRPAPGGDRPGARLRLRSCCSSTSPPPG